MCIDERLSHDVTEPELRRYLRHASTLLASVDPSTPLVSERILILRRARHWLRAATLGVDQLIRDAEGVPDEEVEDPLTAAVHVARIGSER